jgi:haloacetate dehalogenase
MRLALDHPDAVTHLAVLDGVPIGEALARADARFAQLWWHWFFLGQTEKPAEAIINVDPEAWYRLDRVDPVIREDLRAAVTNPAVVHAMVSDYRAGLRADREADDRDKGRKIGCPVLFGWSTRDDMVDLYGDPLAIWREWADDVRGKAIDSGHHMAEENPGALAAALRELLWRPGSRR